MKRNVLIAVLLSGLAYSVFAQSGFITEVNNRQITITGYNGTASNVVIPDQINGMPIVAI